MANSQFEASEKCTALAFGPTYQKAPFFILFDHIKDDAINLDKTERLLQATTCGAHERGPRQAQGK
jgi:hypothetical protein